MADDTTANADDCPPPIPPRPSFTFSASSRRTMLSQRQTSDCVAADNTRPVPPPRCKSKKSTDRSPVTTDTDCDSVLVTNDEVFTAAAEDDVELDAAADETDVCRGELGEVCGNRSSGAVNVINSESSSSQLDVAGELLAHAANSTECSAVNVAITVDSAVATKAAAHLSPVKSRVSCSEFEHFGLDPDLFRPDSLESDFPFSEKTSKFTRSASPLYETVLNEADDETG